MTVAVVIGRRLENTITISAFNTASRFSGINRRGRASQITMAKRAYEKAHGVMLRLTGKTYSERPGFLHSSEFSYEIEEKSA